MRRTRSNTAIEIMKLILGKYPVAWKATELALATGASTRSVERTLNSLTDAGLLEKRYHEYRLHIDIANQFYGAQWYLRQEIGKSLMLDGIAKNTISEQIEGKEEERDE